ncbi:MAG: histidine kinase [Anaerolineae bacterium]
MGQQQEKHNARIEELEKRIAELKSRWPAHSVPPAMLQQLEELEGELEQQRRKGTAPEEKPKAHRPSA